MQPDIGAALKRAIDLKRAKADERLRKGDKAGAAAGYRQCAAMWKQYARESTLADVKRKRLEVAKSYEVRAQETLEGPKPAEQAQKAQKAAGGSDDEMREAASKLVFQSSVTWSDIGGLEKTKGEIKRAFGIQFAGKPQGVKLKSFRSILFYGPPGTGKTMLAAAVSNGLAATFFNVPTSSVLSEFFGKSPKLITALFQEARSRAPAVVYFDEIDALTSARGGGHSDAMDRVVAALNQEMDGLLGKQSDSYLLAVGATNVPWSMDKAIQSRFKKRVYVPLPDLPAREAIFRLELGAQGMKTDVPISEFAALAEGYSGREIEQICTQMVSEMVSELNPEFEDVVDRGMEAVKRYVLKLRPLCRRDLDKAIASTTPVTTKLDLEQFREWEKGAE